MIIKGEDFILTPIKGDSPMYDLELLQIVNKGKDTERTEFQQGPYGVSLDGAIRTIVHYRMKKGLDVVDIKTFLKEYKAEINKLTEFCHEQKDKES